MSSEPKDLFMSGRHSLDFHRPNHGCRKTQAFTRIELLAVLAVFAVFGLITLSGTAGHRTTSEAQICLSNLRQLTRAWLFYAEDNNGKLPGNPDGGDAQDRTKTNRSWAIGWLDYNSGSPVGANTNTAFLMHSQLGRYIQSPSIFKCPSDPSRERGLTGAPRVRSVAMNGYIGERGAPFSSGYKQFRTIHAITDPKPAECFLFIDEREDSINDPWFPVDMDSFIPLRPDAHRWVDYPADWHDGSANLSFVDGHVETWRWLDPRTRPGRAPGSQLALGQSTPNNPDVYRIQKATSRRSQ